MSVTPKASYRKVKRVALLYDMDLLSQQQLFRVDLTIESADSITTPVVPLYEARFTEDNPNALPARSFDPRQFTVCFDGVNKVINRTVYNPYRPNDSNFGGLIEQLYSYPNVSTLRYIGESHGSNYERFV